VSRWLYGRIAAARWLRRGFSEPGSATALKRAIKVKTLFPER
jgi:hypothetical protein